MLDSRQCPKCGDTRIAGPHRVMGQHHVRVDLPGFLTATLEAYTCAMCGYTEFYADRLGLENIRKDGRFAVSQREPRFAYCTRCGAKIRPGDSICYECGSSLD
ncbi:MAG: zinc-ribbon domain-containing protein [Candidatus Thorarchaeota archaeon]